MQSTKVRLVIGILAAASLAIAAHATDPNPLSINTTTTTCGGGIPGENWEIQNGALDICFHPAHASIIDIYPVGSDDNLIDQTQTSGGVPKGFYMDNAGGLVPSNGVPGFVQTSKYIDWWVKYPSGGSNDYTFSEHWIVTPEDPGVHVYLVADHAATNPTTSIGQVQWVIRLDLNKFNYLYMANEDLSNPGPVKIGPMPTYAEFFGSRNPDGSGGSDPGRAVQDATVDMHGYGEAGSPWADFPPISPGFGRQFGDKYDFSGYNYLNVCHGVYGSEYGAWVVFPSDESLVGGPTKQMLLFTGNLDMIEAYSNHLDNGITDITPAGVVSHQLFGPFYVRFNKMGNSIHNPEGMYKDAVQAGMHFNNLYDHEQELLESGYVPSTQRGEVEVTVDGVAGAPKTAWAVLSDPNTNFQYSAHGAQYWTDISRDGTGTFHNVIPGTYRLSVYDLGRWGEMRQEDVVVTADETTTVPPMNFVPENFGSTVWTIGVADRSSHEFLHGHDAYGHDDREYWGNWNYWADFARNNGAVVYNATGGPAGPATNDLDKWNYNHWKVFDPGLFGGYFNFTDDTKDGYTYIVPSYVASLPGASGSNGVSTPVPPWTVNFATPGSVSNYSGGNAVLSLSVAATEGSYILNLNGHQLIWSNRDRSDAAVRSGFSGFTQWIAFQWPVSDLNPAGENNVLTIGVSQTQGDEDDALRLELTNTSADPSVRGWHDYSFVGVNPSGGQVSIAPDDSVPNP